MDAAPEPLLRHHQKVLVGARRRVAVRCAFRFLHGQEQGQDREFDPGERDEPTSAVLRPDRA
jgi:hypothetical protein